MTAPASAPAPDAPTAPAPPASVPAPPADPPKPAEPANTGKTFDEAYVKTLRDEAAANRVKAKDAEDRNNKILAALGLQPDGKTDPDELAKQHATTSTDLRQSRIELAVFRTASKHQADADALLDSRSFLATLADLDPTAVDFGAKVETAIKAAVKDNPKLKTAGQAPARNAGEITGGSGDGAPITEDQLKAMTPEQIVKARAEGKLKHLL
jgi:hypothetical protein